MIHRKATAPDKAALAALWSAAFGDGKAYTDFVFDRLAGLENTWLAEQEGEILASLCAIPVTLRGMHGVYIYGVNTREDRRGAGVMGSLLETVHAEMKAAGNRFAVLVPAGEALFRYYEKFGYETMFYHRAVTRSIPANLWATADFDTITAARLTALRARQMTGDYVAFEGAAHAAMMQDLYTGGATTVETESGYGIFFEMQGTLVFKELLAESSREAMRLLEAARQKTRCAQALVFLPRYSDVFLGEGEIRPYGMLCWLGDAERLTEPYMGLVCD